MTIYQIVAIAKAIENEQIVSVSGTYYPVIVEIENKEIFVANNRREVFYQIKNSGIDTEKVIWI